MAGIVKEKYKALHILVNNAGTNTMSGFPNINMEIFKRVMDINVTGVMMGIDTCAPLMRDSGGGSIVNIGSLAGTHGTMNAAYTTSKWALRGLSGSAAYTLAKWGIRSNVVNPGFIEDTNLTNAITAMQKDKDFQNPLVSSTFLQRGGKTIELANAVLFFASDESSYITGEEICVDGGLKCGGIYSVMGEMIRKMTK